MGNDYRKSFLDKVAENFRTIRESFRKRIMRCGLKFDEDVFSDTLIKCDEKFADKVYVSESEMMAYFWTAFKTNTLRELQYMRNQADDDIPEDIADDYDDDSDIDILFVKASTLIRDKFGDEMYRLFTLHANGRSYTELEKETGISGLKYKFRRIREYVRQNIDSD